MPFHTRDRWGTTESNPPVERLRALLLSLDTVDPEHPDVSLNHDSGWSLSAFPSGRLVWENVEMAGSAPRHMPGVPREKVLALWLSLTQDNIAAIEAEAWLPGYG
ncbi:MAG: hypothetical protein HC868_14245 [Sphingomonadales bacterium]|nr:hypothetical protein [Sphingomonadales bacterium]